MSGQPGAAGSLAVGSFSVGPFSVGRLPRISFGAGRVSTLPEIVAGHGRHVLVVTGGRSFRGSGRWPELVEGLAARGVGHETLTVEGEPSPALVDRAVADLQSSAIDVVVGIGGGSVLDAAKAIAGLLRSGTKALDHLEIVGRGLLYPGPAMPLVAVPSTAGTGSEAWLDRRTRCAGPRGVRDH